MEKKVDFEQLKEMMNFYSNLSEEEKKAIKPKIDSIWSGIYDDFATRCSQDAELNGLYDNIKRIKKILSFDITEEFTEYVETVNAFDPECAEDIYTFSRKKYEYAKQLSKNWATEKAEIERKIEIVKNKKLSIFKKPYLEKLEAELRRKASIVEHYRYCEKKQEEKEFYLARKDDTAKLEKRCAELTRKHAEEAVFGNIEKHPSIVCVRHTSFISSSKFERSYNTDILNDVCNEVRDEVAFSIKAPQHDTSFIQ